MTPLKIMRLPYASLTLCAFLGASLTTQLFGALLAFWEGDWTTLAVSAFFGLLSGIGAAALTLVSVCAFNLLAPLFGGLRVECGDEPPNTQT